jgi:CDP-diacylglycerol---glycerol-3-phosphate 3-phosphatidyltransferase
MFDGRWRHAVDRGTQPVGRILVRAHVTADVITVFGLVMSVVTAVVVGTGHLLIGVGLLFPTGLPDLFDGPVAKASGTASVRGAFLDSVADRVSDAFLLGGVAWFLVAHHHGQAVLLPFAILAVTSLISYQRAKAELLGVAAKGGLMERAERFILLGLCFIAGSVSAGAFVPSLWVFLALVLATALGRFVKVVTVAEGPVPALKARPPRPRTSQAGVSAANGSGELDDLESAHSGHLAEVSRRALARWREEMSDTRWRAWREARAQRESAVPRGSWTRKSGDPSVKRRPKRQSSSASESSRSGRTRVERNRTRPDGRARPER